MRVSLPSVPESPLCSSPWQDTHCQTCLGQELVRFQSRQGTSIAYCTEKYALTINRGATESDYCMYGYLKQPSTTVHYSPQLVTKTENQCIMLKII